MRNYPTAFQRATLWKAITGISILILVALLVTLVLATGQLLAFLQPVLVPVAVAGIIAYLVDPLVCWLEKRKFSRQQAIALVFVGFLGFLAFFAFAIIPPVYKQANKMLQERESIVQKASVSFEQILQNSTVASFMDWLDPKTSEPSSSESSLSQEMPQSSHTEPAPKSAAKISEHTASTSQTAKFFEIINDHSKAISDYSLNWLSSGSKQILGVFGFIIGLIMVPIYLYYFLSESATIRQRWEDYVPIKASQFKDEFVQTLKEINHYLIAFFRGQVVVSLIDGILTGIALKILGLPYAIVIGMALAIMGIIPYLGIILTFIPAAIVAFVSGTYFTEPGLSSVGVIAIVFFVVQQFDGFVIQPKIVGDSVGLHPMTVIFSVLFWSLILGGFLGALLAVPLTAAVKVIIKNYIWDHQLRVQETPKACLHEVS